MSNKIFKVEEGNVLRLVMKEPINVSITTSLMRRVWLRAMEAYNNRESYPYVADWKVGDLVEFGKDFALFDNEGILTAISKPKKED